MAAAPTRIALAILAPEMAVMAVPEVVAAKQTARQTTALAVMAELTAAVAVVALAEMVEPTAAVDILPPSIAVEEKVEPTAAMAVSQTLNLDKTALPFRLHSTNTSVSL